MKETEDLERLANTAIRNDTLAWFRSEHCRIWPKDRSQGLVRPRPNYLQNSIQEAIDMFEHMGLPVRILGLKPRQRGSTTFFSACDYTMLRRQSCHACVIGGQQAQTNEVSEMLKTYQHNDTFAWGNTGQIDSKKGVWSHGSRLTFETAGDRLAGISATFQILHATEVARWQTYGVANSADVLANILKCVPLNQNTMIILESTAEGAVGDFYTRWLGGIDLADFVSGRRQVSPGQYVRVFAPWFEFDDSAIRLTPEQKQQIEQTLDEDEEYSGEKDLIETYGTVDEHAILRLGESVVDFDVWEQLAWRRYAIREECKRDKNIFDRDYPHSWRVAFQRSGHMRFNLRGLSKIRKRAAQIKPTHGLLEMEGRRVAFRQTDQNEAKVTIFERPQRGCRYILTIDPMTGETQVGGIDPDRHGVFVMRAGYWDANQKWRPMATAARVVPCRWDIDVVAEVAWRLARYYGGRSGCKIAIEMNQDRGITEILKEKSADLYQREIFNQREQKTSNAFGYLTNEKTREKLVDSLAKVIREFDTPGDGIDIYCTHALDECDNFVRKGHGRCEAAEGWHDDDVIAIALGVELIDHATMYVPEVRDPWMPPELRGEKTERPQGLGSAFS